MKNLVPYLIYFDSVSLPLPTLSEKLIVKNKMFYLFKMDK